MPSLGEHLGARRDGNEQFADYILNTVQGLTKNSSPKSTDNLEKKNKIKLPNRISRYCLLQFKQETWKQARIIMI